MRRGALRRAVQGQGRSGASVVNSPQWKSEIRADGRGGKDVAVHPAPRGSPAYQGGEEQGTFPEG